MESGVDSMSESEADAQSLSESEGDSFSEELDFAQVSADAELEANLEAFNEFMASYGVEGDMLLAELSSELEDNQLAYLVSTPEVYHNLAQLADNYIKNYEH